MKICQTHKCSMHKKNIRIIYGYVISLSVCGYEYTKEELFPNCDDAILGGCEIYPWSKKYKKEYFCEECNKERDKWKTKYSSEIMFEADIEETDELAIVINEKETLIKKNKPPIIEGKQKRLILHVDDIDTEDIQDEENFFYCLPTQNGNHRLYLKNIKTGEILDKMEINLEDESLSILIQMDSDKKISLNTEYKNKRRHYDE